MPNIRTHLSVGGPTGLGFAVVNSFDQKGINVAMEALGGWLGGAAGAILPDAIDPPNHSWHRGIGHGIAPVGAASTLWAENLSSWQLGLRQAADRHHIQQDWGQDPFAAFGHLLAEWLLRIAAGFVAGFGAGYISHIILDFGTPRCVPLVA